MWEEFTATYNSAIPDSCACILASETTQRALDDIQSETTSSEPRDVVRDETYYFQDGNCVILVGNRLFKIHRYLLERDSAFFHAMFSLPQGTSAGDDVVPDAAEGQSDDNPIIFQDSVEDFQAFCWILYARPSDILAQQDPGTIDIPKLVWVAALAHKYDFGALRDWALGALATYTASNPISIIHKCTSWEDSARILDLSHQCKHKPLAQRLEQDWLRFMRQWNRKKALVAFTHALDAAEKSHNLRQFHVEAYYAYLKNTGAFNTRPRRSKDVETGNIMSQIDHVPHQLSETRQLQLYQGFWSLIQLRLRLSRAPKLDDNPQCTAHAQKCVPGWETWWKEMLDLRIDKTCLDDPGDLLELARQRLTDTPIRYKGSSDSLKVVPCSNRIKEQMNRMEQGFKDSLVDHFMI